MQSRRIFAVVGAVGALLVLGTFRILSSGEARTDRVPVPANAYDFDPASGETRASVRGDDGSVTTLHSGQNLPPRLPPGFTLFPDAEVLEHHRVERGAGSRTIVMMASDRPVGDLAAYYRQQAEAARIELLPEIITPQSVMLAGRGADGLDFTFTARRDGERTRAQLAVGHGL